jgi:hypothetical protein
MAGLQKLSGNSPAIQLVLPQAYIERLNEMAQERRVTRSALIRQAIDAALFGQEQTQGHNQPVTASAQRG